MPSEERTALAALTPERVAEMTDAELAEAVAVHVFGAERVDLSTDGVLLVLETMRERWRAEGITWEISNGFADEDGGADVWCAVGRHPRGWQAAFSESATLGRAVFECALLATAEEVERG